MQDKKSVLGAFTTIAFGTALRFRVLPATDRPDKVRLTQRQPDWTHKMSASQWVTKVVTYNSVPKVEERLAIPTHNPDTGEAYQPLTYLAHKPVS